MLSINHEAVIPLNAKVRLLCISVIPPGGRRGVSGKLEEKWEEEKKKKSKLFTYF